MGRRYAAVMSDEEVCRLLKSGRYRVTADGAAYGKRGRPLYLFRGKSGHRFVRLYGGGKRKAIALSRLVWMSVTGQAVPPGFEIHHDNGDCEDDRWDNLICLHPLDHRKKHLVDAPIPF